MSSFTEDQSDQFERYISYMERLIDVFNWPSCNEIRAYLTIYGKMKASKLSEYLGMQGEKSIYKSLNRLIDAKLVTKSFDPGTKRNAYYQLTNAITNDPPFPPSFISYLMETQRYQLLSDYLTSANRASIGFIEVMTAIMEKRIIEAQDPALGSAYVDSTLFIETILTVPDPAEFTSKVTKFIREELSQ